VGEKDGETDGVIVGEVVGFVGKEVGKTDGISASYPISSILKLNHRPMKNPAKIYTKNANAVPIKIVTQYPPSPRI
jgi:hypothetical protein